MSLLTVRFIEGTGYADIAPQPGCCGEKVPSKPMLYFLLSSTQGVRATNAAPIQAGTVKWHGQEMANIKCRDPESDQLEIFVVDGAHWKPDMKGGPQNMNRTPPDKHFYGQYRMSVIQFERAKKETQTLVLKTRDGQDTTMSFTVQGWFQDSNIDDARLDAPPAVPPPAAYPPPPTGPPAGNPYAQQPANPYGAPADQYRQDQYPPPGPPPQPMGTEPYPPAGGYGGMPYSPGAWDKVSWPPQGTMSMVQVGPIPQGQGEIRQVSGPCSPQQPEWVSVNLWGQGDAGSDVGPGDDAYAANVITILSHSKVHWASLWGRVVLVNCQCTNVDLEHNADVHVFGGSVNISEHKGGRIVYH